VSIRLDNHIVRYLLGMLHDERTMSLVYCLFR
jgi:hypothetical protein